MVMIMMLIVVMMMIMMMIVMNNPNDDDGDGDDGDVYEDGGVRKSMERGKHGGRRMQVGTSTSQGTGQGQSCRGAKT